MEDRYDPETDELTIVADRYSIFICYQKIKGPSEPVFTELAVNIIQDGDVTMIEQFFKEVAMCLRGFYVFQTFQSSCLLFHPTTWMFAVFFPCIQAGDTGIKKKNSKNFFASL